MLKATCFNFGVKRSFTVRYFTTKGDNQTSQPALIEKTFQQLMDEQLNHYPKKDMFRSVNEDKKWTFHDSNRHFNALASGSVEAAKQKPILTALALRSEALGCLYASARANFLWAQMNPILKKETVLEALKKINPAVFICSPKVHKTVQLNGIYETFPDLPEMFYPYENQNYPNLKQVFHTSKKDLEKMYNFRNLLVYGQPYNLMFYEHTPKATNVLLITDDNKYVSLNQHIILNNANFVGQRAKLNSEDIALTTLSMHEAFGITLNLGLPLTLKVKIAWASELFDREAVTNALETEFCTALIAHPEEVVSVFNLMDKTKIPRFKKILAVASPDHPADLAELERISHEFGVSVTVSYGTNETGGFITATNPNEFNSLGTALDHTEIKVGSNGNLLVKGFNLSEESAKQATNGFFDTGVKAKINNGNLNI